MLIATLPATAGAAGTAVSSSDDLGLTVPGDHSAGDQYVETLPTIGGPRAPKRNKRAKKLSKGVSKELQQHGGSDAAALERLATSADLGAPAAAGTGDSGSGKELGRQGVAQGP